MALFRGGLPEVKQNIRMHMPTLDPGMIFPTRLKPLIVLTEIISISDDFNPPLRQRDEKVYLSKNLGLC